MPKIDFYVLTQMNRFAFAAKLIEKAHQQQHRVYVHTDTKLIAEQLDQLLWTYREEAFLPHNLYGDKEEPQPPIQIGYGVTQTEHNDILLNLSDHVPAFHQQFQRILEIVTNDATLQQIAREHYRLYREQNFEITTHKLETV